MHFILKSSGSQTGGCPSVLADDDSYLIIGTVVDATTMTEVDGLARANDSGVGVGETVVRVPRDVLDRLPEVRRS